MDPLADALQIILGQGLVLESDVACMRFDETKA